MSDLFLLTEAQMRRIEPYFPLSHGVARVDDQRVISRPPFVRPIQSVRSATRRYDADLFRQALAVRGITACIPSKSNRAKPIEHDRILYRERHKIENDVRQAQGWRRIHTRYDRCAHTFDVCHLHRSSRHLLALINEFLTLVIFEQPLDVVEFDLRT